MIKKFLLGILFSLLLCSPAAASCGIYYSVPQPDLVVTDIWTDPDQIESGVAFTIYATITNRGAETASVVGSDQDVYFYVDTVKKGEDTYDDILSMASVTVDSGAVTISTAGDYTVKVTSDVLGEVTESDETNNDREEVITVEDDLEAPADPQADLIVTDVWTEPAVVYTSDTFKIKATIKNQGNKIASAGPFWSQDAYFYYDGDVKAPGDAYDDLAIEGTVIVESTDITASASGTFSCQVVADATEEIAESDETNNSLSEALVVIAGEEPEPSLKRTLREIIPNIDYDNWGSANLNTSNYVNAFITYGAIPVSGDPGWYHWTSNDTGYIYLAREYLAILNLIAHIVDIKYPDGDWLILGDCTAASGDHIYHNIGYPSVDGYYVLDVNYFTTGHNVTHYPYGGYDTETIWLDVDGYPYTLLDETVFQTEKNYYFCTLVKMCFPQSGMATNIGIYDTFSALGDPMVSYSGDQESYNHHLHMHINLGKALNGDADFGVEVGQLLVVYGYFD